MPEIATGAAEAAIAGWLVSAGDAVTAGQAIVEIETEKATVEFEAEEGGVLAGVLAEPGDTAAVGTPIAVIALEGESADAALAEVGGAAPSRGQDAEAPEPAPAQEPESEEAPVAQNPAPAADSATPDPSDGQRLFASPIVRKLARERGLDLGNVQGTGPNGRIVRRDIEGLEVAPAAPQASEARGSQQVPGVAPEQGEAFTDVPHTGMRRAIARRLQESKSTIPHFYLVADCRVDELLALRAQINSVEGTRVSVNDLVVKAVAGALQDVPEANAIWTADATRRFEGVDISVAVSVPSGLLTPVVRGVEKLSVGQLGSVIRDLAERARDGKLKQHELEGGSFSVSNLGMYGTTEFSAILNPPQSGILAVGAATRQPVVEEDGSLGVASVMTVTLSADHRVLDGALAAEWLAAFKKRIEHPLTILV